MKKTGFLSFVLTLGVVIAHTACSKSDSPTAPRPSPTPQGVSVSLTVSSTTAVVGTPVEARATVRQGTAAAPDGTPVKFVIAGGSFPGGVSERSVTTQAGVASTVFTADDAGTVKVFAAVGSASDSKSVVFFSADPPQPPQATPRFFGINPSSGSARGGYNATISGQWLCKWYVNGSCATPADVTMRQTFRVVDQVVVQQNGTVIVLYKDVNRDVAMRVVSHGGSGVNDSLTVTVPEADSSFLSENVKVTILLDNGLSGGEPTKVVDAFEYQADYWVADVPAIFEVVPNNGSWQGGEQVTITGRNLCVLYWTSTGLCETRYAPWVLFTPGSFAEVVSVSPDGSSLTVKTPSVSTVPITEEIFSRVAVRNVTGETGKDRAFRYRAEQLPPLIYSVQPSSGSARGGDTITIWGANFVGPVKVDFSPGGTAQVVELANDGTWVRVKTPENSVPLDQDTTSSITVTVLFGTGRDQSVTKASAFTFKAEVTTPILYALSPNAGPIEGGTRVTIFGSGFQYPVQVLFGGREAQVISSNFNQIVCIAPSIAPSQPGTPTTVAVEVVNILTGKRSTNTLPYRYGEAMFVSGITPNTGYILGWTPATIYGQGFVAPVQVVVNQGGIEVEAEVLSVSGTSLQVRIPPYRGVIGNQCAPVVATIRVTNLGSNLSVTGPTFTYLCSGGISGP